MMSHVQLWSIELFALMMDSRISKYWLSPVSIYRKSGSCVPFSWPGSRKPLYEAGAGDVRGGGSFHKNRRKFKSNPKRALATTSFNPQMGLQLGLKQFKRPVCLERKSTSTQERWCMSISQSNETVL